MARAGEGHLEQLHASGLEGRERSGEVQAPCPHKCRIEHFCHAVDIVLIPLQPVLQSLGIVQPQILHIQNRKIERLENLHHLRQARRARAGKNVALGPRVHRAGVIQAYAMDQPAPAILEAAVDDRPQLLVMVRPHMFEHTDGGKRIELAAQVAVIVLDELDLPVQPFGVGALPGEGNLLPGYVVGCHRHTVVPGHMQRQCPPAAARFHHFFTRLQAQFAAYVIQLRNLGIFKIGVRAGEIRAGVHHPFIEPELVEVVADVVVVVDVAARPGEGVAPHVVERSQQFFPDLAMAGQRPDPIDRFEKIQQVSLHLYALGRVQLAEVKLGVGDQFQ